METDKKRKDSVFSAVFPSSTPAPEHVPAPPPAPAPRPAPAPAATAPALSGEQTAALERKIELLGRDLGAQLDAKLAGMKPALSPAIPAVISKMTEMEARFKEFQEKFLAGALQMKNIEESKISARREIEELLKAVREQQKYSELDRQMHTQLEKAWLRVEEMEKRMLDAYAAAANRPAPPPAPVAPAAPPAAAVPEFPAEEIKAEILKAIDLRLEERFGRLEALLKNIALKAEDSSAAAGGLERRLAGVSSTVEGSLGGIIGEVRRLREEVFGAKEQVEDVLESEKKELFSSVREAARDGNDALVRHMDAAAASIRERLEAVERMFMGHLEEVAARDRRVLLQIALLEGNLKKEIEQGREGRSNDRG